MGFDGTELSEAIAAIRSGLEAAQVHGQGSPINFKVRDIALDLSIELRSTTSGGGGVKAFVVSADARTERAHAQVHRLTVNLQVDGDPSFVMIGDGDD